MKISKQIIIAAVIAACFCFAANARAKGIAIEIESLSGGNFNPWEGEKNILSFSVLQDTNIIVRIFDMSGSMVKEAKLNFLKDGRYKFTWDGKDGKGKIVDAGFYKYEVIAASPAGATRDNDNTIIETRKTKLQRSGLVGDELPEALYDISGVQQPSLKMDMNGYLRTSTGANTGGVNWNREEIYFNLKGDAGTRWIYDMTFFPSYTMNQPFQVRDILYNGLIEYRSGWGSLGLGYRNYLEGYYDPLRLLTDYQMGSDRISVLARVNLLERLHISTGAHILADQNIFGMDARATYDIFNGIMAGGAVTSCVYDLYNNIIVAGDGRVDFGGFTPLQGTIVSVQVARNIGSTQLATKAAAAFGGNAVRMEAEHKMFYMPSRIGELTPKYAFQRVDSGFVADFADIPNGIDSVGSEIGADYFLSPGLPALESVRNEIKATLLTNILGTISTNKFRENISLGFVPGLSFAAQYEYTAVDNKSIISTAPISKSHNSYGEIRFYKPGGKSEFSIRGSYTYDTAVTLASISQYSSVRLNMKYHFVPTFAGYLTYERANRFTGTAASSNQDYHHIMPGIEWMMVPATKTEMVIQAGSVINNAGPNAITYYFKLGHYFLESLSSVLTVGSQTSIDSSFRAYLEIKYDF